MKSKATMVMLLCLVLSMSVFAQERGARGGGGQAPPPATDTVAPEIPGVVKAGTKVQVIKDGFNGTEGPIGLPDGSLIFTETTANRITKIDKDGNTSTFLENTNGSNGLAFDSKGRLISVQTTPGNTKIRVIYPKGSEAVLTVNFEGKQFGRPNDLVVDKKGGVYFSEPGPNAAPGGAAPASPPLPPTVYYVPAGGKAMKVAEGIERPNGIQLSPDEKVLYVNNSNGQYLLAFDIKADGTLQNRRNFAKYEGVTRNASEGGLLVAAPEPVSVGSRIGVVLRPPDASPVSLHGQIVRADEGRNGDGAFEVGLRLVGDPRRNRALAALWEGAPVGER